ncbi:tetratricopeptide repeat-containing sensor histidine kinase [Lutibacter sp. A80]|uniref:tetratricopeptide repeat-containing sensor histidine kinase n=1 Tax=Lutibacter sp. A80 TaxID=2918453 RepID=UPI001F05950B|nr:tetratricopeptide repeat-containing sensor histidine kinase [Lutibacter sp. A80]UMB60897.1 tetratricopeptide repeat-containing sensor histidine kinase [Lutibacter sp. A80]
MIKNITFLILGLIAFKSNAINNSDIIYSNKLENFSKKITDSTRISKLLDKAKLYYTKGKIDSAFNFYNEGLELARKSNIKSQIAEYLFNIATYYQDLYQYALAIEYYERALIHFEDLNQIKKVAEIKKQIGDNYSYLTEEDKAIDYYFKSLIHYRELKDQDGVADNYIGIGNLYYGNEHYDFAERYYNDALEIFTSLKDTLGIATSYTNLANATIDADINSNGVDYYFKSIDLQEALKDYEGVAINFNNIGDYYMTLNMYDEAKFYLNKALEKAIQLNTDKYLFALIYLNLSDLESTVKNYDKAIYYGNKSLEFCDKLGLQDFKMYNLKNLSTVYENIGNRSKALNYLKEYIALNDTIIKTNKRKKIILFTALNKLEESNFKINELSIKNENEKKIMYFLVIAIIIFGLLVIILILQQTSKKKAYNLLEFKNYQISRMHKEIKLQTNNLKLLNDTKDKIFSIIAHDLKNPFNSIIGFTELLIENIAVYDEEKQLKFLKIVKGSTTKASDLLNNLLIWANSQSGTINFNPVKIELIKQVSDVISLVEIQAINKEISIFNNVYHNLYINADVNMLNTILRNLLSNSIKFTKPGGEIYMSSIIEKTTVTIVIKDNGIGMSQETIDNLFSIDNKTSSIGTANEQGSGLGLILCKDFVEKHGGKIWAESTLNTGSMFMFSMPIYQD